MRRRDLIAVIGGAAVIWPLAAWAQPAPKLRLEMAGGRGRAAMAPFVNRMRELGYVEGDNFTLDFVDVQGHIERYGAALQEIVSRKPDIILAAGPELALKGALAATHSLPIVMVAFDYDPVALGYVTSLARPTGNVTGVVSEQIELTIKRLQLVKDTLPGTRAATVFWDSFSADQWRVVANAADAMGLRLEGVEFRDMPYDYERALDQVSEEARHVLIVLQGAAFTNDGVRLCAAAREHRMASFFAVRQFVDAGGLMSYGINIDALYLRAAEYVDRIACGAKPSDLPIEQPTKFELVINLKTATAIGLAIPPTLLARADDVIE